MYSYKIVQKQQFWTISGMLTFSSHYGPACYKQSNEFVSFITDFYNVAAVV